MPPFHSSLSRRWSPLELPIHPFLAPRVFQPWPYKSARVNLKTETGQNQDNRELLVAKAAKRKETLKRLQGSSTNVPVQPGTKYIRFSKRRTNPASFTHVDLSVRGSVRHFSSRSGFGKVAESNGEDGLATEGQFKAPHELKPNARMETQPNSVTLTHQYPEETEGSAARSSQTSRSPIVSPRSRHLHLNTVPKTRHLRLRSKSRRMPFGKVDTTPSYNAETSRSRGSTIYSLRGCAKPTSPQSSSSAPPSIAQTESLAGLVSPSASPSITPPEKPCNDANSYLPVTAAETVTSKRPRQRYAKDSSRRLGRPILGTRIKTRPSRKSAFFFRRPAGYKFPRENFRRPKGLSSIYWKISLDRQRLYSQRFATIHAPFQALHEQYEIWAKQQGLPKLSTKYLKVDIDTKANIMKLRMWSERFAIINQRHEDALKGYPKLEYNKVAVSKFPTASRLLFVKQDNVAALASIWRRVPSEIRSDVWEELMLTSMDQYPASTLKLLLATYQAPSLPPRWAANDCLDFVVSHYFGSEERKPTRESFTPDDLQQIFESIRYLRLRGLRLSARSVYLLQSMMNQKEFRTFYLVIAGTRQHLTGSSLLRFTYRFARSRETDLAFQVLQQATKQGFNLNRWRWPQICTVLLARRYRDPHAQVTDTELFDFMLHHGLRPGIVIYNVLIQNSLQAGDHPTAWQIYDMMIENGVEADAYTYSIMQNDAKIRGDDIALEKLAHWMNEDGVGNSYTVTDTLDAVFRANRREYFKRTPSERKNLQTPFSQMIPIYLKNFNVEPLAQLIPNFDESLLPPISTQAVEEVNDISVATAYRTPAQAEKAQRRLDLAVPEPTVFSYDNNIEQVLMEPNHVTLIVMLKAYIASVRHYKALLRFYSHFKSLISTKNPIVAPLLEEAQIYNHLLVRLGNLDAPMHDCLDIIADMQSPLPKPGQPIPATETDPTQDEDNIVTLPNTSDESDGGFESDDSFSNSEDSFRPPAPSLHTWNTLLNVFMQRRQPRAAEKVLQIMIEKEGLKPTQATWNALTMGYMRLQDPVMTADALIRTKKSGFIVDQIMASRWWLRFQARARLSEALESAPGGNETSLADVANAIESESEMVDPADEDVIDEEVLETTTSRTGDIYRILKRRLHAVNSPVHPNWIFDAMIRVGEENIIEQEAEQIPDNGAEQISNDVVRPEVKLIHSSDGPGRAIEEDFGQLGDSAEAKASMVDRCVEQQPLPSATEDRRESRLLPANRLVVRKVTQFTMSPGAKAFRRKFQAKVLTTGVEPPHANFKNDRDPLS
ncbi:2dbb5af4-78d6-43f1-90c9-9167703f03c6 [Sclerotinia trifoliorum]|uniref:2dbb5af4-78d6-43f1-90c9-9167703f03c6 n=1 Tax=Sclerotinia trifoliorum TaxID=28548 RepID=A0A8H2VVT8_9HELO|nr:2dbb5af4-78d6-43f1-90c9-9167703f03c6 [Sclerotinia trifoliorum]